MRGLDDDRAVVRDRGGERRWVRTGDPQRVGPAAHVIRDRARVVDAHREQELRGRPADRGRRLGTLGIEGLERNALGSQRYELLERCSGELLVDQRAPGRDVRHDHVG